MLYMASDCLSEDADAVLSTIENCDPLNDFVRFERYWADPDEKTGPPFSR